MTETEQKALALLNEVRGERRLSLAPVISRKAYVTDEAVCRAIEAHDAFRQEVSDAVEEIWLLADDCSGPEDLDKIMGLAKSLVLPKPKPDPLKEVLEEARNTLVREGGSPADFIREALAKRGLEIREIGDD